MDNNFCKYCFNSRICDDDDFTDKNDYSAICVGNSLEKYNIMFCSGWGRAPRIEFDVLSSDDLMHTVAVFYPKFCPFCGREITEYNSK